MQSLQREYFQTMRWLSSTPLQVISIVVLLRKVWHHKQYTHYVTWFPNYMFNNKLLIPLQKFYVILLVGTVIITVCTSWSKYVGKPCGLEGIRRAPVLRIAMFQTILWFSTCNCYCYCLPVPQAPQFGVRCCGALSPWIVVCRLSCSF